MCMLSKANLHRLIKISITVFCIIYTAIPVCAANMNVGDTAVLDGGGVNDANYGSGTGTVNQETGEGGSYSGGGKTYVPPDNENETQFQNSKASIQAIIAELIARANASSTANLNYGDILKNGSTCTIGFVQPTWEELRALINNADNMYLNTSLFDPNISNRYEYGLTGGGLGEMPSVNPATTSFTDAFFEDGAGADIDSYGNVTGEEYGHQTNSDGYGTGPVSEYHGVTDINGTDGFRNIDGFLQGIGAGMDIQAFMDSFNRQFNFQTPLNGMGRYQIDSQSAIISMLLGPDADGFMRLTPPNMWENSGNTGGLTGIRNDLVFGGLNIAGSWEDRFRNLATRYSGPISKPPTFSLLTEYRVSNVRVNDRTNVHFIPDTRYWSIDKPNGETMTVKTEDPYLVFTPQEQGTYNFRCSQEATFTVRTLLTITKTQYLFDSATGSILYFHDSTMAPYSLGATQQQRYIPTRGYTIHVNDLNEIETVEDKDYGIIERIE